MIYTHQPERAFALNFVLDPALEKAELFDWFRMPDPAGYESRARDKGVSIAGP